MSLRGDPRDEAGTPPAFRWTTFDLTGQLPADWQQAVRAVADTADFGNFPRTPDLSREAADVEHIYRGRVRAAQVREHLDGVRRQLGLAQELLADAVISGEVPPVQSGLAAAVHRQLARSESSSGERDRPFDTGLGVARACVTQCLDGCVEAQRLEHSRPGVTHEPGQVAGLAGTRYRDR